MPDNSAPLTVDDVDIAVKVPRRSVTWAVRRLLAHRVTKGRQIVAIVEDGDWVRVVLERDFFDLEPRPPDELAGPLKRATTILDAIETVAFTGPAYDDEEADQMSDLAASLELAAAEIRKVAASLGS